MPFTYTTNNGTITITGYTGTNTVVTIPSTINGYPVTSIGAQAFSPAFVGLTNLTNVTIGTNVTSIGRFAFNDCMNLTNVTIPVSVTTIDTSAFAGCQNLLDVTIPNNLSNIGAQAFFACQSLTSVTIPSSVANIGTEAFAFCNSVTNFSVVASNLSYSSLNGVLFNKAQTILIQFPAGLGGNYTVPNSVTTIGDEAFGGSAIYSVTIPSSVTAILQDAFYDSSLTNAVIGNSVSTIGQSAFAACSALKAVYFMGNAPGPNDTSVFSTDYSAIAYYLSGATGWGATFDGIPTSVIPIPPALGMSTYANQPAVFFPTATGTNFVLQMTTNLSTGPRVTVSNGIPISGLIVTNPAAAAFFRLH